MKTRFILLYNQLSAKLNSSKRLCFHTLLLISNTVLGGALAGYAFAKVLNHPLGYLTAIPFGICCYTIGDLPLQWAYSGQLQLKRLFLNCMISFPLSILIQLEVFEKEIMLKTTNTSSTSVLERENNQTEQDIFVKIEELRDLAVQEPQVRILGIGLWLLLSLIFITPPTIPKKE